DGIRDDLVTGVQTCALPIWSGIPSVPWNVAYLDDVIYGRADTDGSTLASGATATATTLSVATGAGLPLWTTSGGDFPFDIAIAEIGRASCRERGEVGGVRGA